MAWGAAGGQGRSFGVAAPGRVGRAFKTRGSDAPMRPRCFWRPAMQGPAGASRSIQPRGGGRPGSLGTASRAARSWNRISTALSVLPSAGSAFQLTTFTLAIAGKTSRGHSDIGRNLPAPSSSIPMSPSMIWWARTSSLFGSRYATNAPSRSRSSSSRPGSSPPCLAQTSSPHTDHRLQPRRLHRTLPNPPNRTLRRCFSSSRAAAASGSRLRGLAGGVPRAPPPRQRGHGASGDRPCPECIAQAI